MKRRWYFPPRYLLVSLKKDNGLMTSRTHYRGGGSQRGRGFSSRSFNNNNNTGNNNWKGGYQHQQFLTGDSHFRSVQDANLGFHHGGYRGGFNRTPPPYDQQEFRPRFSQPRQFRPPPPPPYDHNQQEFRSHFSQPQQFRPPPSFNQGLRPPRQPPKELVYRNWEYAKAPVPPGCEKFIVLSYNILADYLALDHKSKLYSHVPDHMLSWKWRKGNILFELGLWSADILCLQEVDRFPELEEELKLRGYSGIWKMRTGNPIDGCAVFWRTSRFKLVYEESIEFNKVALRDNVAQICVLELKNQNTRNISTDSDLPPSLSGSNRVVICNIHVLYNPKRGEIKLGQVRILLNRAHAVSKLWNDAPVVLCGDFNSTPKSPLYNFILEQKLDLSEVDRDKVSGQVSAQLNTRKPYNSGHDFNPSLKTETPVNSIQSSPMIDNELDCPKSDILVHNNQEKNGENILSVNSHSQPARMDSNDISSTVEHGNTNSFLSLDEIDKSEKMSKESCKDETEPSISVSVDSSKENPNLFNSKDESCYGQRIEKTQKSTSSISSHLKDAYSENEKEKENSTSLPNQELLCEEFHSKLEVGNIRKDSDNTTHLLEMSEEECNASQPITSDVSSDPSSHQTTSSASTITGNGDDKNRDGAVFPWESNEFPEEEEVAAEDERSFLSALHGSEASFSRDFGQITASNLDQSFKKFASLDPSDSELLSHSNEMFDDIAENLEPEFADVDKNAYNPSLWTPMEIAAASGNAEFSILEHPLKLKSAYAEVEGNSGTRDPNGEPVATSYNRCFLGTVDYIWCSECLHTTRVLAPIPKHAMEWTKGFPTKKWGSDHIALVSELALPKASTDNSVETHSMSKEKLIQ